MTLLLYTRDESNNYGVIELKSNAIINDLQKEIDPIRSCDIIENYPSNYLLSEIPDMCNEYSIQLYPDKGEYYQDQNHIIIRLWDITHQTYIPRIKIDKEYELVNNGAAYVYLDIKSQTLGCLFITKT